MSWLFLFSFIWFVSFYIFKQQWVPQFLCDNGENDVCYYMITVYTGMRRGSATMSNVNFIIVGEEEDSGIRLLSGSDHNVSWTKLKYSWACFCIKSYWKHFYECIVQLIFFQGFDAGSVRRFLLGSSLKYGRLNYLRIWHDNSGQGDLKSWFLNKIIVDDLQTKERYKNQRLSFLNFSGSTILGLMQRTPIA